MDRRESLKALLVGSVSTVVLADACHPKEKTKDELPNETASGKDVDRMAEEKIYNKEIAEKKFFDESEMLTITLLGDIIIPRDHISGSASDAKVPEFIEYIVNDMPEHQTPMRGGIRWLNIQCLKRFNLDFNTCSPAQRLEMVDEIAYPAKAKPEMKSGVAFFNLMRNLTATGFYTSKMGVEDVGYMGNKPNFWNGVPDDVLKQYNLSYSEKQLKECISYDLKKS